MQLLRSDVWLEEALNYAMSVLVGPNAIAKMCVGVCGGEVLNTAMSVLFGANCC